MEQLLSAEARRIALAAQGFGVQRSDKVTAAQWRRTIDRLSLHQIDSVNILVRAHYMPAFSRLGPYDRSLIDTAAWGGRRQRRLFEYSGSRSVARAARIASPAALANGQGGPRRGRLEGPPRLRDRAQGRGRGSARSAFARGSLRRLGLRRRRSRHGWWEWTDTKRALEWLFWAGHITTATRRGSFERVYDLTERVIPAKILALPTPDEGEAHRALVERAALALGVATALELCDYFRLGAEEAKSAIEILVEAGILRPVEVPGRGSARVSAPRRPSAPTPLRPGPSRPFRPARMGAVAHLPPLRFPLPDRDLYACGQAATRLLCPALPSRQPACGAARPQGRPPGRPAPGPCRTLRAARALRRHGRDRRGARRTGGLARARSVLSCHHRSPTARKTSVTVRQMSSALQLRHRSAISR